MANSYQRGTTRRVFACLESSYGVSSAPIASNFTRTINYQTKADPTNKRDSKEKKRAPGIFDTFAGRVEASLEALGFYVRPSGAPATLPEHDLYYQSAFGAVTNPALATTVDYGTGDVDGATLASVTGLVANRTVVAIQCPDNAWRHRLIKSIVGNVVTWAPDLPAPPADGAAVKSVPTYRLTTGRGPSLGLYDYNITVDGSAIQKRLLDGVVLDKISIAMDANEELLVSCSGMGRFRRTEGPSGVIVPAEPGSVVTVGDDVPLGMIGEVYVNDTLIDVLKTSWEITNGYVVDNRQAGTIMAREAYRAARRAAMIKIAANNQGIDDLFERGGDGEDFAFMQQFGFTAGYGHSLFAPRCEVKEPNEDDPETETSFDYELKCKEETYDGNTELVMGIG